MTRLRPDLHPPADPMAPLRWGYNRGLPRVGDAIRGWQPGWSAAWGTRAQLVCAARNRKRVPVRYELFAEWQSVTGPQDQIDRLVASLASDNHTVWLSEARLALTEGRLRPGSNDEMVLFTGELDTQTVTVKANHQSLYGWLHVCAYTPAPVVVTPAERSPDHP